jgi:hypothetical protein
MTFGLPEVAARGAAMEEAAQRCDLQALAELAARAAGGPVDE